MNNKVQSALLYKL